MLTDKESEMTEVEKLSELSIEDKAFLKSKTPASLPDNPSSKGFSAGQIKAKMSDGFLILFDWINLTRKSMNASIEEITQNLNSLDYRWNNPVETFKNVIEQQMLTYIQTEKKSRIDGDSDTLEKAKAYSDSLRSKSKEEIDTKLASSIASTTYLTIKNAEAIYPTKLAVTEEIKVAIDGLINGASESLDTLREIAKALGDDPNFASTVSKQIGEKADTDAVKNTYSTKSELETEQLTRKNQDDIVLNEAKAFTSSNVNTINEEVAKKINETVSDARYATKTELATEASERKIAVSSALSSAKEYADTEIEKLTSNKVDKKVNFDYAESSYLKKTEASGTYATKDEVKTGISEAVSEIVGNSKETLDTIEEIGKALGEDPNFATTVTELIGTKISTADADNKFATKTALNTEVNNRAQGDGATLTSAKNYTDTEVKKVDTKLSELETKHDDQIKSIRGSDAVLAMHGLTSLENIAGAIGFDKNFSTTVNTSISNETAARESADTSLDTKITTEIEDRESADTALSNKITAEAKTRASEDTRILNEAKSYTNSEITTLSNTVDTKLDIPSADDPYAKKSYVDAKAETEAKAAIDRILDGAPEALDTLKEIADVLGSDDNLAGTITGEIANKVDKDTADSTYATYDYVDSVANAAKSNAISEAKTYTDGEMTTVNLAVNEKLDKTVAKNTYITKELSDSNDATLLDSAKSYTDTEVSALRTEAKNEYYTTASHVAYNKEIMGWTYGGAYIAWPGTSAENLFPTPPYASFWAASLAIQENKTDIESKLSAEEAARIEADESLQEQVTDINGKYASKTSLESVRSELKGTSYVNGIEVYIDSNGEAHPALASWKSLAALGMRLSELQFDTLLNVRDEESARKSADSALDTKITDINTDFTAKYNELAALLPTKVDKPENDEFALLSYVNNKFTELIGAAPEELNTLKELADALGEDKNFAGTVTTKLANIETSLAKKAESSAIKDWALKTELASETSARTAGDTAALKSAKDYTDAEVGSLTTDVNTKITNINTSLGKKVETSLLEANYDTSLEVDAKIAAVKDEVVTGSGFALNTDLEQEVKDRQAADTALDTKISNEATARASAITAIKGTTTPTNLKTIEAISASLGDKTNFVSYLSTELGKKANTSAIKNWALQTSLDSEASTRATADTSLQEQITALGSSKLDKPASGSYALQTEVPALAKATAEKAASDAVAAIIDSSPEALDTLNEIAASLGNDPNFATTILSKINTKLDTTTASSTYATKTALNSEASTRASADKALEDAITEEATTRASQDEAILSSAKKYTDDNITTVNTNLNKKLDSTTASTTYATITNLNKKLDSTTASSTYATKSSLDATNSIVNSCLKWGQFTSVAQTGTGKLPEAGLYIIRSSYGDYYHHYLLYWNGKSKMLGSTTFSTSNNAVLMIGVDEDGTVRRYRGASEEIRTWFYYSKIGGNVDG